METPKPPASSELRRPSTRPYTRRKRAATVRDTDGIAEPSEPGEASQPATALAVAEAVATAVAEAVTAVESALPGKSKSKAARPRSRAKTQPATPVAIAAAAVAPAIEPDSLDVSLEAIDLEASLAKLTDVTLEAKRDGQLVDQRVEEFDARRARQPVERPAAPLSLDAQLDASLDVIETLIDDMLDVTRPIAAPLQATLTQAMTQQIAEPPFTELPSPRQLPTGAPTDPASPPGLVPRGDSRSLRRGELFALVYRVHCFVVTRHGTVGQLGYWSAVEYPTPASASHAYARGCSHWVSEGFSDYRG